MNKKKYKKYHVHVYKVSKLIEIDVYKVSEEEARREALKLIEMFKYKKTKLDCKHIAIAFEGKGI